MNNQLKQYTGTKTVKARPMTMGEAYERKLLKEGRRPSECETDKAGYLVEYEGGYQSWSPADVFEKAYKPSETIVNRMLLELEDLEKRMYKCDNFLSSDEFSALDALSRALLTVQRGVMGQYYFVLTDRFIKANKMKAKLSNFTFGTAVLYLKAGMAVRRAGWNDNGLFVIKQVPAHIKADIIPNMQSLPQSAKKILMSRDNPHIDYENQMLIIRSDRNADSWHPTPEDIFAEDWELVIPPINK